MLLPGRSARGGMDGLRADRHHVYWSDTGGGGGHHRGGRCARHPQHRGGVW